MTIPSEGQQRRVACNHEERRQGVMCQEPLCEWPSPDCQCRVLDHPHVWVRWEDPWAVPTDELDRQNDLRVEVDL
eukprot:scaffold297327_cov35-Tisochrysis_lutea.AAC.3